MDTFKDSIIKQFEICSADMAYNEWDFVTIANRIVANVPILAFYKSRMIESFKEAHETLADGHGIAGIVNFLFAKIPTLNDIKMMPYDIKIPRASAGDESWTNCADGKNLPPARHRVIVTDGNIETQAWISATKGCWEGWAVLDDEYLDKIIAWRNFPKYMPK